MKKENNKGFSLIEIVIAMAMIAIVVLPILQTFIASARINRNARQTMIQTDVAQTIMEGFADKTFMEISETAGKLAAGENISGNPAPFSSINDNEFNKGLTANVPVTAPSLGLTLTSVAKNQIVWQSVAINTIDIGSDNSISMSMNQTFGNDVRNSFIAANAADPDRKLMAVYEGKNPLLFLAYGNIEYGGYHYDAVVSFVPMAKLTTDKYYTYNVFLTLYEYDPNKPAERFTHALMKMESGIMAGR